MRHGQRTTSAIRAFCLGALFAGMWAVSALAQAPADFPSGNVRIIVPFVAGGPTDVVARILGDLLSAR